MMERKIIIYSSKSSNVCCFILALISLIPGCHLFGLNLNKELKNYNNAIKEFGFPLEIFNNKTKVWPLFTLFDMDSLNPNHGYIIGTTNKIVCTNKKLAADAVFNMDTKSFEFNEKSKLYTSENLITKFEKEIINKIQKQIKQQTTKEAEINIQNELKDKDSLENLEDWMISNLEHLDDIDDFIRNEFKNYFFNLLADIALVNQIIQNKDNEKEINELTGSNSINKDLAEIKDFSLKSSTKLENNEDEVHSDWEIVSKEIAEIKEKKKENADNRRKEISSHTTYEFAEGKNVEKLLKKILNNYNIDFLNLWSQTHNFQQFIIKHNPNISFRSVYVKYASNVSILYENGDSYLGEVSYGKKNGIGTLVENINGKNFTYNGNFIEDKKHGVGTISSEDGQYVYDGEFVDDVKEGEGQLLYYKTRYSGQFKK